MFQRSDQRQIAMVGNPQAIKTFIENNKKALGLTQISSVYYDKPLFPLPKSIDDKEQPTPRAYGVGYYLGPDFHLFHINPDAKNDVGLKTRFDKKFDAILVFNPLSTEDSFALDRLRRGENEIFIKVEDDKKFSKEEFEKLTRPTLYTSGIMNLKRMPQRVRETDTASKIIAVVGTMKDVRNFFEINSVKLDIKIINSNCQQNFVVGKIFYPTNNGGRYEHIHHGSFKDYFSKKSNYEAILIINPTPYLEKELDLYDIPKIKMNYELNTHIDINDYNEKIFQATLSAKKDEQAKDAMNKNNDDAFDVEPNSIALSILAKK